MYRTTQMPNDKTFENNNNAILKRKLKDLFNFINN